MIAVACAIILHEEKVLVTQRGWHKAEGGLWEFPGGKLEPGESATTCIIREIAEELALEISPLIQLQDVIHHYPDKTIKLLPLICRWQSGTIHLHEHAAYQWLTPGELNSLQWCPADLPVVEQFLLWHEHTIR